MITSTIVFLQNNRLSVQNVTESLKRSRDLFTTLKITLFIRWRFAHIVRQEKFAESHSISYTRWSLESEYSIQILMRFFPIRFHQRPIYFTFSRYVKTARSLRVKHSRKSLMSWSLWASNWRSPWTSLPSYRSRPIIKFALSLKEKFHKQKKNIGHMDM